MSFAPKTALVTGANRGLGAECARLLAETGCRVYVGSRSLEKAKPVVDSIAEAGHNAVAIELDVSDSETIAKAAARIEDEEGSLDLLINNAGIHLDETDDIMKVDPALFTRTFATNVEGLVQVSQGFIPLLRKAKQARIVNVSSRAGQISSMDNTYPAYGVSKAAVNAVTRKLSTYLLPDSIPVNAVTPGWCQTDMGGKNANRTAEEGAQSILRAALEVPQGNTGNFYFDKDELPW